MRNKGTHSTSEFATTQTMQKLCYLFISPILHLLLVQQTLYNNPLTTYQDQQENPVVGEDDSQKKLQSLLANEDAHAAETVAVMRNFAPTY